MTFNGLPVRGAIVATMPDGTGAVAIVGLQGFHSFPDLANEVAKIAVDMFGLGPVAGSVRRSGAPGVGEFLAAGGRAPAHGQPG
jgi:hypothetical protein